MSALATAPIGEEQDYERFESERIESERIESELRAQIDSHLGTELGESVRLADAQAWIEAQAAAQAAQRPSENPRTENKARRWMWGFLIALGALQIYYVQEMLAALFLFSLVFIAFGVVGLALYAANRASQAGLTKVEPYARLAARAGRRTFGYIEYLIRIHRVPQ